MKQFVIIGLSHFGRRVLDELLPLDVEIMIIDKDREIIEEYKDSVAASYVADAIREELIENIVPENVDAAIIDLGKRIEASILVTNYLKKRGVPRIIAKAETDQHGEILDIVGATDVIFPNREAAHRITLPLVSSSLFNYFPISKGLVMAELELPDELYGKTLVEGDLRKRYGLNVIAVRKKEGGEYSFVSPTYRIEENDIVLTVGKEDDIAAVPGGMLDEAKRMKVPQLLARLFHGSHRTKDTHRGEQ